MGNASERDKLGMFEKAVLSGICRLGKDMFLVKKNYNQMHGHVLGVIAGAAIGNGFDIAIDLPHALAEPFIKSRGRQLQARPDLTLLVPETKAVWGLVEYESGDINGSRLEYKRHLLLNWRPQLSAPCEAVMVVMTVPSSKQWSDSPTRSEIEHHRDQLAAAAASLGTSYSFAIVDASCGIELRRFKRGQTVLQKNIQWDS